MSDILAFAFTDDKRAAVVALTEPRACACHRMTFIVVNRDGKTRCVDCDTKYAQEKKP